MQYLVSEKKDIDKLVARKVAIALVLELAKQDVLNETVFSKLTDDDLKETWVVCTDMFNVVKNAFKRRPALERQIRAAKKKNAVAGSNQTKKATNGDVLEAMPTKSDKDIEESKNDTQ